MSEQKILPQKCLGELFQKLGAAGNRILAPVRAGERIGYEEVTAPQQMVNDYVQTNCSAKSAVFPRYEEMLRFKLAGKEVKIEEAVPQARPTILFGTRPCDAASFATLQAVFTWDSSDAYFQPKLATLTVISMSCTKSDAYCFCTSVGGGPGDTRGSDILLTPLGNDSYLAEILTEKGKAVVALAPGLFTDAKGQTKDRNLAQVQPRFEAQRVAEKLPGLFGRLEVWTEQSLRCIGCGCCAYVCPTCSCFDIQDERDRYSGVRVRCWDSCGFGLFTLHASGHNPRNRQSERWRQRVMHKFSYQPERQNVLGCVGCGRCSRSCPADMNLGEHVQKLAESPA